jgi:glutamate dehydrogenase
MTFEGTRSSPSPVIEALVRELQESASGAACDPELERFVRLFFARLGEDEFSGLPSPVWLDQARGMLDFARRRQPGETKVRVFNPDSAHDGWQSTHSIVQIVNDDMPFLVDSVTMALNAFDVQLHAINHPVTAVQRDPQGELTGFGGTQRESLMHIEFDRQIDSGRMLAIEQSVRASLNDVRACVSDWQAMRERMLVIVDDLADRTIPISDAGREEARAFLRWAADDHFTFLGYREYVVDREGEEEVLRAVKGSSLGLLTRSEDSHRPRPLATLAAHYMPQSGSVDALILTKTNARSTVHRPGYMDYIGVLHFDPDGRPVAEQRFIGLYTSSAYTRRPWDIPLVRGRYNYVLQESGFAAQSHSWKTLRHILETLPRDELFQSSGDELLRTCLGILSLQERVRTRLFLRRDRYGRFFSALVYIPRDRFNTDVRLRIGGLLQQALKGERLDSTVAVGESPLAQLHLIIRPRTGEPVEVDVTALEQSIVRIVRNWHDELTELLIRRHGEHDGLKLAARYGKALPAGYIEDVSPEIAADDCAQLSALSGPDDLKLRLYRSAHGTSGQARFKLMREGSDISLSEALPLLENLGLRIRSEHPYALSVDGRAIHIQDFEIESSGLNLDVAGQAERFEAAFDCVWREEAESDGFNRLVLSAGLDWRQIAMLRAYAKFLLQAGVPFSQSYMEETLTRYPLLTRLLVALFESRFDPDIDSAPADQVQERRGRLASELHLVASQAERETYATVIEEVSGAVGLDRDAQMDAVRDGLEILLGSVNSLDEDRILRSFIGVMSATLRTSFYQRPDGRYRDYLSLKFDSGAIPDLPRPRPYREIFVYSPRVEGVHLRFGPVARGGLRWSDRREDFRTEVLGLVKAQMVKNTVIVPVGAKGGFFVKRPPVDGTRDQILAEGVACYRSFISGLLDITDNYRGNDVVHPDAVVRHDDDDPYLVVAADKGTATFSDIANAISLERGFWLGDAFASGGSVGYDHKGMGITARGAWESVKRHFRALGIDCQSEDFTVVGIGDMSGDVFGNGMLLSRHIRLLAAFDHRHIFIDPDPDVERSYIERERLFAVPRSSWEDYDKALISEGGGVWSRSLKSIPLSEQARAVLGIDSGITELSPNALLTAILKAPVDLLWNGGIGTYVKASRESHEDVGDRANTPIRVDGAQLRCRVVGEGGNLGLTQLGRIEAALQAGVLLNTDFIDNSAGVDTSDHEVNIKILLDAATSLGRIDEAQRNALLAQMTDEVAELVLFDNYRQNQAISLMERMSVSRIGAKQHLVRTLESQGLLDRKLEHLPSESEFAERRLRGLGLTRPELAILLSYAKIVVFQQILVSRVPEDPYLSKELLRYFPVPLQERFGDLMEQHRLRREIIATAVTNSTINRMGATFVMRMQEDTGETLEQIVKAFTIGREVLDARVMWTELDTLDLQMPEVDQIDALGLIWSLLRQMTRWLLNLPGGALDIAESVARFKPGLDRLRAALRDVLVEDDLLALDAAAAEWTGRGVSSALAGHLASLPYLSTGLDIVKIAEAAGRPVADVARVYFRLGDALHIKWLATVIEQLPVEGRWHALARGALRDELQAQQTVLVTQVLADCGDEADPVAAWLAQDDQSLAFTLSMFADMRSQRSMDYPSMQVGVRRLAQLASVRAG